MWITTLHTPGIAGPCGVVGGSGRWMAGAPRIAIIDDEETLVSLIADVLTDEGYAVEPWYACAGAEAFVAHAQPALVILDLVLGTRAEGLGLAEALRANAATATVPLLICTADTALLREQAANIARLRAAVLEKPFDLEDLIASVRRLAGPPATPRD